MPVGGGAQRTNCAAPERAGTERRRQLRHFITELEKRPAEPAFDRRKPPKSAFCPAEIVLSRMKSRLLTTNTKPTGLLPATTLPTYTHIRKRVRPVFTGRTLRRTAATYSPTWSGSTIGDDGLSFSVRNGKRRFPVAIATAVYNLRENQRKKSSRLIFPERKISGY